MDARTRLGWVRLYEQVGNAGLVCRRLRHLRDRRCLRERADDPEAALVHGTVAVSGAMRHGSLRVERGRQAGGAASLTEDGLPPQRHQQGPCRSSQPSSGSAGSGPTRTAAGSSSSSSKR
jgi:hypothetical protein